MKAFAIKFNNDHYWCGYNNSDKQLRKAVLYKTIKMAEETAKDCMSRSKYIRPYTNKIESYEIVKVTIAEGDLEQKNNILKAFIKAHHPEIAKINDITLDIAVEATDERLQQENKQLKQQLSEKDKEIERLKKNMEFDTAYYIKELANVRKQVCEEIRELLRKQKIRANDGEFLQDMCYWQDIGAILDKVERGE